MRKNNTSFEKFFSLKSIKHENIKFIKEGDLIKNYKLIHFFTFKMLRLTILLIVIALISFLMIHFSPIDPVSSYLEGIAVSPEKMIILQRYWGVNLTLNERIINWITSLLQFDLGISLIYRRPVIDVIREKFTASLILMTVSWLISGIVGFILGIIAGAKRGSLTDKLIKTYCYILQSSPSFWIALILMIIFSVYLKLFPFGLAVPVGVIANEVTIWEWLYRLILPTITLSIIGIASIALYTRDRIINIENSDYFLFAKARGESRRYIILKHGIRNVLLPALTLQFLSFNELFGGTILIEQVFSYPGIGQATVAAGLKSDVSLLLGIVLISTIFVFVGNMLADISYKYVDVRMRDDNND